MSSKAASQSTGVKRAYQADDLPTNPVQQETVTTTSTNTNSPPQTSASAASAFRNVSACNRCRVRKNRCDQRLPACSTCEKAGARCVGYDHITKREIPRSYVYYLETRLAYFESLLSSHGIPFDAAETYDADSKELGEKAQSPTSVRGSWIGAQSPTNESPKTIRNEEWEKKQEDAENLNKLVSNIGMVSVQGASDPRYLGSTSGISFARVVLAAVKSSVSTNNSERAGIRPSRPLPNMATAGGSSMRDSYFGLQTKPSIKEAPFPERHLGEKLVHLYFEHANPQIPILHRGEFMEVFSHAYSVEPPKRTSRQLYLLNIVFAIGAGIIWGSSDPEPNPNQQSDSLSKKPRLASQQAQPEEYHASAIIHLGSILSSPPIDGSDKPGGDLEELQAVLLLAGFALLRPVAPGLWYIIGVAMRLAVDLGLHYEDGSAIGESRDGSGEQLGGQTNSAIKPIDAIEKGRREWMRDLRRRLWWCTYTFDRLVSTCVGRPFGVTDQVVTTEFPSLLEDRYITKTGFLKQKYSDESTYKRVSHHYFRLRLLQSEILQVLQHQQTQQARINGTNRDNEFMHTELPSPFLARFESFRSWRRDIDQRLYEWKESAPQQRDTGVGFSPQFLELNYWQAVIMLYRQSLSVPAPLAGEVSPTEEVSSPSSTRVEEKEDEDHVFLKCAEAGQKTLKLYRQLHRLRLVNYTYLATHHLFMAGISFLYAVWHSPAVRHRLTLDDFDFTVLAATSVLGDLMEKCPPAEACKDAFERMSKATVQMCMSTPGFGFSTDHDEHRPSLVTTNQNPYLMVQDTDMTEYSQSPVRQRTTKRPPPQFDMDLRGLFPEDLDASARPSQSFPQSLSNLPRMQFQSPYQQQQGGQTNLNSQLNSGMGMSSFTTQDQNIKQEPAPVYMSNSYNPDFMSVPGMDFLNSSLSATGGAGDDINFDASGLDLGFGMNLDYQHDWSDGQQFDLFDGFFFGGNGGGGFGGNAAGGAVNGNGS